METLSHLDRMYLDAAQGWLGLGNPAEAAAELDRIAPELLEHPEILEVRWQLAVQLKRWEEGLEVAEILCREVPESAFGWIHRSYCLHELNRTEDAWDTLLPMAGRFPYEWLVCYNLACYACQMGRLEEARNWLQRARDLGETEEIDRLASSDTDLIPLFQSPPA
jgi:tetratricopeptide (TPR) repeat protein